MKPTEKFTDKAEVYAKHRRGYTDEYIKYLLTATSLNEGNVVADIGSGTGILSRQLLESGLTVIGVEPNDDMRTIAEQLLKQNSRFISMKAAAEHTTLDDKSVDLLTAAQAFHWFDKEKFKLECQRILRPSAKVALVWNSRDGSSALNIESAEICQRYCPNFKGFSGGIGETEDVFKQFYKNGKYDFRRFRNDLEFDFAGFLGRYLSASYAPKKTDKEHEPFISAFTNLFEKYGNNGKIIIPNVIRSYLGEV
ncbi:class I SAM-dependent methyltransferase [Neobacillus novalis]|uniref:Class I SAM-dependent methyltransferase n=1 Tax=Neobacillus novalis TaxID=220687 RepID=A0AA95SD89_9BACI|nr:class I SAM-dependent methyltransferase [Neobacillus novalis]WHY86863.1 class I SAM-dependent methyltransferase [Neobacillus novalis]